MNISAMKRDYEHEPMRQEEAHAQAKKKLKGISHNAHSDTARQKVVWDVLADYDFQSIEFWEPTDMAWKRLIAKKTSIDLKGLLHSIYVSKWGPIDCSLDIMGIIEAICVAEWDDRSAQDEEEEGDEEEENEDIA